MGNYLKESYNKAIKVTGVGNGNNGRVKKAIDSDPISDNESFSDEFITNRRQIFGEMESEESDDTKVFRGENSNDLNSVQSPSDYPVTRLIYSEQSPDYCIANATLASKGTLGRICSRRKGPDVKIEERKSCRNLCKKCGYRVKKSRKRVIKTCNCKFKWCCQVECESCAKEEVTLTCAPP